MMTRLFPVVAFFLALLIFFGYVNPTYTGPIVKAKGNIAQDNKALAAASAYTAKQSQLAEQKNAIDASALGRLTNFLPDSVDNVGLILDLNALANRSGVALTSADVTSQKASAGADTGNGAGPEPNPVSSVSLSLSAVGPYSSFRTFLEGIENSVRILDVTDLTVKGSDTGVYTYQMTLTLYWLR